jgi:hypothetical protein
MACRRSAVRSRLAPPIIALACLATAFHLTISETRAQRSCLPADAPLTGILSEVRGAHPNGTQLRGLQLDLGRDACMVGAALDGGQLGFSRVHVVPADASVERQLRNALGQRVTVRGRELMEAHTAWHLGDAVLLEATMVPR